MNSCICFLHFVVLILAISSLCFSYAFKNGNIKHFNEIVLRPYQWQYIKVDFPESFSTVVLSVQTNVYLSPQTLEKLKKSRLPVVCLREGGLPLPDVDDNFTSLVFGPLSNEFTGSELCFPAQKNVTLKLTNEQIFPGVWYIGFFNRIGPTRTQAKMINRGEVYSFVPSITIEKCNSDSLGGPNCDQQINHLLCTHRSTKSPGYVVTCSDSEATKCLSDGEARFYVLVIENITDQLTVEVKNVEFKGTGAYMMCYARRSAIPTANVHNFSVNISHDPLIIHLPKAGRWYFSLFLVSMSARNEGGLDRTGLQICFSLRWIVFQCPPGKTGPNCSLDIYTLQMGYSTFQLKSYLSIENSWAYFLLDISDDDAGQNLLIQLESHGPRLEFEVYARYEGLASSNNYDYFYASNHSTSFQLFEMSETLVRLYILYLRKGIWAIGIRRSNPFDNQTSLLISVEGCPNNCTPYGMCKSKYDVSNSMQYSYCTCDLDHGGFDCSVTIVSWLGSHGEKCAGHLWHSMFLAGSNAAALLPAFWCLRHQAYMEWVVFMLSGIASGIYHTCDAGNPCLLSYDVLQFMDVWLSFMAVVSTFVHLTYLDEGPKGAIQMCAAFVTSLLAKKGATKSTNIPIVLAIGAMGLLLGLLIELGIKFRSYRLSRELHLLDIYRWQAYKHWLHNLFETLIKRFRWRIFIAGFISLEMAIFCWSYETADNYWVWHSLWHITIYTASFLFICSKAIRLEELAPPQVVAVELD